MLRHIGGGGMVEKFRAIISLKALHRKIKLSTGKGDKINNMLVNIRLVSEGDRATEVCVVIQKH